jgi:hypothetical protein
MKSDHQLFFIGFAVFVLILLRKGLALRSGTWSGSQWKGFILHFALCAGLLALAIAMPNEGLNRDWPPFARLLFVVTQWIMMLYGGFIGMGLVAGFAGTGPPQEQWRQLFIAFALITLAFGAAKWLSATGTFPYVRSGAFILGTYCLWLGVRLPKWAEYSVKYRLLFRVMGETGTRFFYGAVGLAFIGFGIFGRANLFE